MADTSDFRNGLIIKFKNDLYTMTEFQHVKPGKGGAFVRTMLKNLRTGKVLDNTFRSGESVEVVRVERRKYQYLFKESAGIVLMDNDTFEQLTVSEDLFGDRAKLIKEGDEIELLVDDVDQIISADIPIFVYLEVKETEPGFKGDTANNVMKPATMETGAIIQVPLFVNEGEKIKIDTRIGAYVERVKN
ncbi:MAG: elongation factor P [Bacteroidetes bacterium]|nr:elongation factor P [Bacteroidota bacterium]